MSTRSWLRARLGRTDGVMRRALPLAALGILAWAAAIALWALFIPAERRQIDSMREARTSAEALARRRDAREPAHSFEVPSAEGFRAAFPLPDSRPQRIETLLSAASHKSLVWQRTEFRVSRDSVPGLVRDRITLPITGRYEALRYFVAEALLADRALALDRLLLRRSGPDATQIEIETIWSLYTRDGKGAPPVGPAASAPP